MDPEHEHLKGPEAVRRLPVLSQLAVGAKRKYGGHLHLYLDRWRKTVSKGC